LHLVPYFTLPVNIAQMELAILANPAVSFNQFARGNEIDLSGMP
jgi:hypothetical protein